MKKIILTLLLFVASTTLAYGQFEIKAFAGTNFANLSDEPSGTEWKAKAGYHLGVGVLIGEKFYVEPSFHIVKQTKELTVTENTQDLSIDFTQNFVKIPVMLGYHVLGHESGPLALRIFGGPAAYIAGSVTDGDDLITKDDVKNTQFMLDAGVGIDVFFLFAELNYENAFSDYFEEFRGTDAKHRSFGITVGVHLDF